MTTPILDPCCGSRMFYFDKHNPLVTFGDFREERHTLCDGRKLKIEPDMKMDFRNLPFPNDSFHLVIFDPPHLKNIGNKAYMALKYGRLSPNEWQKDLKQGFQECFRVLKQNGTLVFKWNESQIPLKNILELTDQKPVIGHKSGRQSKTHWVLFFKEE